MKIRGVMGLLCFVGLTTGGCVMSSTYNGTVAELYAVRSELDRTKTQSLEFAEQVRELEEHQAVLSRQMEATSSAVRETSQQMEAERKVLQERLAKLTRLVGQLTSQQYSLRQALQRAKEDQAPLQASVDRYRVNMGGADEPIAAPVAPLKTAPNAILEAVPAPSAPPSVMQDPVPNQAAVAPANPSAAMPKAQPVGQQSSGPVEEGWLSTIKGWVVSIWQSIFS